MPRVPVSAWLCGAFAALAAQTALPAPYVPQGDEVVLERLPASLGGAARDLRAWRDRLAQRPKDLALAVRLARHYITLGQAQADPRYYGYAQASLRAWWPLADPPPEVLLLRAAVRQSRHEFDAALADLARLLKIDPRDSQAWLMQAVIYLVRADYPAAMRSCEALLPLRQGFLAMSCMGSVASLSGKAQGGYQLLVLAEAQSQRATTGERVRLQTLLGKTAERLGDPRRAEGHFQAALALDAEDAFLLAAYADFLLDQGRPRDVLTLLRDATRIDGLLLRLTLAEKGLGESGFENHVEELRARFAASRQRGDTLHQGDEARFLLQILNDPQAGLRLAEANWAIQREPRDARILLEAALAAGEPAAARPVLELLDKTSLEDPRLRQLAGQLRALQ